jgi:hypothetical protein
MKVRAFLADSVQSVDGKLYVLGAGWNRLAAGGFPARHDRVGIGVLLTINATFQTGPPGDGFADVSVPFALNIDGIVFPAPGTYAVSIRVDGEPHEQLTFRVDLAGSEPDAESGTSSGRGSGEAGYL